MNLQAAVRRLAQRPQAERRFTAALAASVVLHALFLLPPSWALLRPVASPPLIATLRMPAPAPAVAAPTPAPAAAVPAAPPAPSRELVAPKLRPRHRPPPERSQAPVVQPAPAAVAPASPAQASPALPEPPIPGPPAAAQALAAPVSAARPAERGEASEGADVEAMSQYRFALARATVERYPALARERGLTGEALVRLSVSADGMAQGVSVARSSGHAVLDAAAKEMIAGAASRAAVPQALRGRGFSVELPVQFRLRRAE